MPALKILRTNFYSLVPQKNNPLKTSILRGFFYRSSVASNLSTLLSLADNYFAATYPRNKRSYNHHKNIKTYLRPFPS
jgi:hypothetical protein